MPDIVIVQGDGVVICEGGGGVVLLAGGEVIDVDEGDSGIVVSGIESQVLIDGQTAAVLEPDPFDITAFAVVGGSISEIGATVLTPSFSASYATPPGLPDVATLTDSEGTPAKDVTATPESFSSDGTFVKTGNNDTVAFTLAAELAGVQDNAIAYLRWRPRTYWGVGGAALLTEAEIESMDNHLDNNFATTFPADAPGAADYVWYSFPQSYDPGDNATFQVGQFPGGFYKAGVVSVTNVHGIAQDYACWRSDYPQLGTITVQVY